MWKSFINFWAAPDWQLLGFIVGALIIITLGLLWWLKTVAKNKEKEQKKNAITLSAIHIGQLFKLVKVEEDKVLALLSLDPTREYSSGTGDPVWAKLEKVPDDLKVEGKVIKVVEGVGDGIKIVAVKPHELPTEKETEPLREARIAAKAAAEAEAKALELQKTKKTA